jgi:hypothetical protein
MAENLAPKRRIDDKLESWLRLKTRPQNGNYTYTYTCTCPDKFCPFLISTLIGK